MSFSDKPDHRFKIQTKTYRSGPKSGQDHDVVILEIGPYKFSKGVVRKDVAYFNCNSCRKIKISTCAKARIWNEKGYEEYELIDWPTVHVCK